MRTDLQIEIRFWLYAPEGKLLGKGRVELLERIRLSGSLAQAAREMKMSYRQAWQMVKEMNERADSPLVVTNKGGKQGGGAHLTAAGHEAVTIFKEMDTHFKQFVEQELEWLNHRGRLPGS